MKQKGFTLVELILAMAFFSFVLMFVIVGFVQINRSYTRGVTVRRVQNAARLVVEDIARALRGVDGVDEYGDIGSGKYRLCIGDLRYGWNQNTNPTDGNAFTHEKMNGEDITLVKAYDTAGSCGSNFSSDTATTLLDESTKIQYLEISPISNSSWRISVTVSSEVDSDLSPWGQNAKCKVGVGDQFCDVASLETVVSLRN